MSPGHCLDINIRDGLPGYGMRKPAEGEQIRIGFHGTHARFLASIRRQGRLNLSKHRKDTYGHFDCVFTSPDYWTADGYTLNIYNQRDQLFPFFWVYRDLGYF